MTQHVLSATQVRKKPTVADDCLQLQARAFFNDFWIFQLFGKSLKWLVQVLETWYRAQNWSRNHTYDQLHYSNNQ